MSEVTRKINKPPSLAVSLKGRGVIGLELIR